MQTVLHQSNVAWRKKPSRGLRPAAEHELRDALMALARRPAYGVSLALAGVVARSWELRGSQYLPVAGLDALATRDMLESHFPGADALLRCAWQDLETPGAFVGADWLEEMSGLLVLHRTVEDLDSAWLAHALSTACLEDEPLWQGLYLSSELLLDDLMQGFFASLAVQNRRRQPWKTCLFEMLALQRERYAARADCAVRRRA